MLKHFSLVVLLFLAPPLYPHDDIPDEVVKAYWKNCALYLVRLTEDPPPRAVVDDLIRRMVEMRPLLNRLNWETINDPESFFRLLQEGD